MMSSTPALDLISTSPTKEACASPQSCIYANVWFAYQIEGKTYGVTQGCCNHWDCPRCGVIRAKTEYARIVYGIHELASCWPKLWFQTITCRGKEISRQEADGSYLQWTNRLLDSYRQRVKRSGGTWVYVQVTERQKRGHPHSHFLTTFSPEDCHVETIQKWKLIKGTKTTIEEEVLQSTWLSGAVVRAGLGPEYNISEVRNEAAASRYVAKYMFKASNFRNDWPKGWKRVRYSQSFPKLPEVKTDAFVLRQWQDWDYLARRAAIVVCADETTFDYAGWKLHDSSVVIRQKRKRDIAAQEVIF